MIERLHSQKRELHAKVDALTTSVEEYKVGIDTTGLSLVDEEVDIVE